VNSDADQRNKFSEIRKIVLAQFESARRNARMNIRDTGMFWSKPALGWGRPLQLLPALVADRGRIRLTLAGRGLDSGLYVALVSLCYARPLEWVRQCETCEKWFIATRKKSRFCSTLCRVKWHAHTEEGKRKRAAYMQQYRANPRVRARNGVPKGYHRKRGRKLHVDLKKGE
jgi:hypothetical protein